LHFKFQEDFRKTTQGDALIGWEGVLDEAGNPLPLNSETKDKAFGHIAMARAIEDGFIAVARGEHLRKN
jgi:hypothetical protein